MAGSEGVGRRSDNRRWQSFSLTRRGRMSWADWFALRRTRLTKEPAQ
jgi:hypothetical protein